MVKAVAINGSPRMERGYTELLLTSFIQGIKEGGCEVDEFYASRLTIKPCNCGIFYCWDNKPGECCHKDDMQKLYPMIRAAELLILATPVYIPLPGDMQNMLNRLMPFIDTNLVKRQGRTRARLRTGVNLQKIILVAVSGWWEMGNFDTVVRIVSELAEVVSIDFGGAVLRPHAHVMKAEGKITKDGETVLDAARRAGNELIQMGKMKEETLKMVSHPLITEEEYY